MLRKANVGKGDVVSIVSENCLEYLIPVLATLFNGATVSAVNPEYKKSKYYRLFFLLWFSLANFRRADACV